MAIRPDMVGIVAQDVARAVRFYRLLGLEFPDVKDGEDFVECKSHGYRISLNAEKMAASIAGFTPPTGSQRMELAFLCDSPAEVDATFAKIAASGSHGVKEPWDAFWGQRYAIVSDPDGTHISLFAPLK